MSFRYEELFQRNIGVFTPEEQGRIRGLVVAVAGCGGLGSAIAYNLARLGVGGIRLADPEACGPENVNHQYGAFVDTIGVNKARATAGELKRINPGLTTLALESGATDGALVQLLDGADIAVNAIDFFEFEAVLAFHAAARERRLWVVAGQGAMEILTGTAFDPAGHEIESMMTSGGHLSLEHAVRSFFPRLPRGVTLETVASELGGPGPHSVPYHVVSQSVGAALCAEDLVRIAIRDGAPFAVAPGLYTLDLATLALLIVPGQPH